MANLLLDATNQCTLFTLDIIPFYDENKSEFSEFSEFYSSTQLQLKLELFRIICLLWEVEIVPPDMLVGVFVRKTTEMIS